MRGLRRGCGGSWGREAPCVDLLENRLSRLGANVTPLIGIDPFLRFRRPKLVEALAVRKTEAGEEVFDQFRPFNRWEGKRFGQNFFFCLHGVHPLFVIVVEKLLHRVSASQKVKFGQRSISIKSPLPPFLRKGGRGDLSGVPSADGSGGGWNLHENIKPVAVVT